MASHAPLPLSGVVVAMNERDRIGRCLESLLEVCTEVVLVDSGSTDGTVELAAGMGVRVVHHDWPGFAAQKNFAISQASQPWVLLLDADEWLEPPARDALRRLFASGEAARADVWLLLRRTHFMGRAMQAGSFAREPVQRLFRSHHRHAEVPVHEYLLTDGSRVVRSTIRLEHDTARDPGEYWRKLQRYARLSAEASAQRGRRSWPGRGLLAAAAYLVKNLLLRGGLVDGPRAWHFHWLHARYAALKYRLLLQQARASR